VGRSQQRLGLSATGPIPTKQRGFLDCGLYKKRSSADHVFLKTLILLKNDKVRTKGHPAHLPTRFMASGHNCRKLTNDYYKADFDDYNRPTLMIITGRL